jgi:hypothetical protein
MSSAYNKQFNFRELRVTGLQVWSKISGRSLINNLNDGLLYKLRKNGISDLFYNIIKNMYQKTEILKIGNPDTLSHPHIHQLVKDKVKVF